MNRTPFWLPLVCLLLVGCSESGSEFTSDQCRPRKLARMDGCHGEDHSFQECRFYLRATGRPDASWCEAMMSRHESPEAGLGACDLESPSTWAEVPCDRYGIAAGMRCFSCLRSEPEAEKTYVYGYAPGCATGVEQVTCNMDPVEAGRRLASARR